ASAVPGRRGPRRPNRGFYVGNLGNNGNKAELERAFGYYGPLQSVWVARNPPGFAFVEFEDPEMQPMLSKN
uniref:RRM domain-containing protein n=1 Tax=Balaenoptera musculus TaxID=9771 RepID=A0A8C0CWH6_BALMU